jgi:hypothetical protein
MLSPYIVNDWFGIVKAMIKNIKYSLLHFLRRLRQVDTQKHGATFGATAQMMFFISFIFQYVGCTFR